MTAMPPPALMEPEDLLLMPDGERYELIDGIPKERGMGMKSSRVSGLLLTALNVHITPVNLGRAYPAQAGYRCFPGRPRTVRYPDVSFISIARMPDDADPDGFCIIAPDLAVEVVSPNDEFEEVETKIGEYRSAGVSLIWIVSPISRTVMIRRLDRTCAELDETGTLSGEGVVPGFQVKVADLFV